MLYAGLTIADIRRKMLSERRNELMAELFHRVHFIEKWGRGIKMILEREPQTEFEELGIHFIATFKRKNYEEPQQIKFGESTQKTTQKTTQKILELITANPQISRTLLAAEIGITPDGIKYHLSKLSKEGVIKRIGPDKGGYWAILDAAS